MIPLKFGYNICYVQLTNRFENLKLFNLVDIPLPLNFRRSERWIDPARPQFAPPETGVPADPRQEGQPHWSPQGQWLPVFL